MNKPPAVWIFKVRSTLPDSFQPILWGLEEEGIPFEIREVDGRASLADLAKEAADGSPLSVGIGVDGGGGAVLHHHDLPDATPLFSLAAEPPPGEALRHLGMNAARLVKGQPLILDREGALLDGSGKNRGTSPDEVEALVGSILAEILDGLVGER